MFRKLLVLAVIIVATGHAIMLAGIPLAIVLIALNEPWYVCLLLFIMFGSPLSTNTRCPITRAEILLRKWAGMEPMEPRDFMQFYGNKIRSFFK